MITIKHDTDFYNSLKEDQEVMLENMDQYTAVFDEDCPELTTEELSEAKRMNAASGVGRRIRRIRTVKGITQAELAERVCLSINRIQQYECGFRKPKMTLLLRFADALNVSPYALYDPIISSSDSSLEAMFTLFDMDEVFGIDKITENDADNGKRIYLSFVNNDLNNYMTAWYRKYMIVQEKLHAATSEAKKEQIAKEYNEWKWSFPKYPTDNNIDTKKLIRDRIDHLQKLLEDIEKEESGL